MDPHNFDPRTFQAKEMKDALALVRRELGPDAVIISTRRVPGRAMGLLGGSVVEVSAYRDDSKSSDAPTKDDPATAALNAALRPAGRASTGRALTDRRPATPPPAPSPASPDLAPRSGANHHAATLALARAKRLRAERNHVSDPASEIINRPEESIAAATGAGVSKVARHAGLRRRLLGALVPRDLCEELLGQITADPEDRRGAEDELHGQLRELCGRPVPLFPQASVRVAALVGPTGVGKTTTIAKIAARAVLHDHKRVVLISLDDQRIGAVAQLRAYADVLQIPLKACSSRASLSRTLASVRDADMVLIDSPGIAPSDQSGFNKLETCFARAGEPVSVHMCVAASTRLEELDRTIHLYRRMQPHAIIATKLDEAVALGSVFAARRNAGTPFSFVTTGQRVPEDIAIATPDMLVDTLLGTEPG